jgi:hypothetical protein
MKKTIFYIPLESNGITTNTEGDFWFDKKPYKELMVMEDFLYEPNGSIVKDIVVGKYVKGLTITNVQDRFSNEGIIRRIALYISI